MGTISRMTMPSEDLAGWNILPLAVRLGGVSPASGPTEPLDTPASTADSVPTIRGVRHVLGHHKAVAAWAEGPSYLQVTVLVDDAGRTASVGEDGSVIPGEAIEELAATVQRMTGQRLEPAHPHLRRALVLPVDAPELPMLAAASKTMFSAISHEGWSVVVADDDAGWWALQSGLTGPAIVVSSDGVERSIEVRLSTGENVADPTGTEPAVCRLLWGPQWTAVSAPEDSTAAARLTREVVDMCDARTSQVHSESVASIFDLDPVETKRLLNYVQGESTSLVLESVLQLLGLPVIAAKVVEGTKPVEQMDGVTRVEPGSAPHAFLQALTQRPTAAGIAPAVHRAVLRHPELLLAVAGLEAAAGTGLAAWARRSGRAAPALGALSALAFTDAAGLTAWYSAAKRRQTQDPTSR